MRRNIASVLVLGGASLITPPLSSTAFAQGTAFTYQGRLNDGPNPANGSYDLRFSLYDAVSSGAQAGAALTNAATAVSNGLFTVTLDFGPGIFTGGARWLEIAVRTNGGGGFNTLVPRQLITPAPYAINAANLMNPGGGPLDIAIAGQRVLRLEGNITSPNLVGGFRENYAAPGVAGATVGGGGALLLDGTNGLNRVTDNYGTVGGGANNQAGNSNLDLEDAPNATVAGGLGNTASGPGSTIAGGYRNEATGISSFVGGGAINRTFFNDSVVAGGYNNLAVFRASVLGGANNQASNNFATIGGGFQNVALGLSTTIGGGITNETFGYRSAVLGGSGNRARLEWAFVGGGQDNQALAYASVAGGARNLAAGAYSSVGGGATNQIDLGADQAAVGGGAMNLIQSKAPNSTIAGGLSNTIGSNAPMATIGGGAFNSVGTNVWRATIGGGAGNTIEADPSLSIPTYAPAIGGGNNNRIFAPYGTIAGGSDNVIAPSAGSSSIGGGFGNRIETNILFATIGGGSLNLVAGQNGFAAGYSSEVRGDYGVAIGNTARASSANAVALGYDTTASGFASTALGLSAAAAGQGSTATGIRTVAGGLASTAIGFENSASGSHSFAAGRKAQAMHANSFVWSSYDAASPSFAANTFFVNAPDGLGINCGAQRPDGGGQYWINVGRTASGGQLVETSAGATLTLSGVWQNASDRSRKTDFAEVDPRGVLEKLAALPVRQWRYTNEMGGVKHMGPTAQDFQAAFGLGSDEKSIGTVDADGVALAAIQGLNQKLHAETAALRRENAELKSDLAELKRLVETLKQKSNEDGN